MSTQNSISEENILNWDEEAISKNIEHVVRKVRASVLSEDEEVVLEYVVFALEKVIQKLAIAEVEQLLLKDVCCAVSEIFQSTINGIESINDLSVLSQTQMNRSEACFHLLELCCHLLVSLLQACHYFLTYDTIQFNYLENYIRTVDVVSKKGREHYSKRVQFYKDKNSVIDEFYKKLVELQSQYFLLVATKIEFDFKNDEGVSAIQEIFGSMTATAIESLESDVVLMANTWKFFLNFVEKFHDVWIKSDEICRIVQKLCGKIEMDFDALLESQRDIKDLTNSLKVDNFLLKIVIKLCRIFVGSVGDALDGLFSLLLVLFRSSPTFLRSSGNSDAEINEITKQLSVGAEPLLASINTENEFWRKAKTVVMKNLDKNPYGCLLFLISVWKKSATTVKSRKPLFDGDFNGLELIFNVFEECHGNIVCGKFFAPGSVVHQQNPDLYEYVFITLLNTILTITAEEFGRVENILLRNILQPYPWRAMLACDIWTSIFRYGNSTLCDATMEVLIPIFLKLRSNTARPELTYLSFLLRRLIPLTSGQFLKTLSEKYPPKMHTNLWGTIGLKNYKPENEISNVAEYLMCPIQDWSKSNAPNATLHTRMQDSLVTLSSIPFQLGQSLLKKLWDSFPDIQNKRILDSYLSTVAAVTAAATPTMSENDLVDILCVVSEITSRNLSNSQKFSILKLLRNLSSASMSSKNNLNRILDYVTMIFKSLLESESVILRNIAMHYFTQLSYSSTFMEHIGKIVSKDAKLKQTFSDFLMKILPKLEPKPNPRRIQFYHRCYEDETPTTQYPKKIKLDEEHKIADSLSRLEQDMSFIIEHFSTLSLDQKTRILSLYNNFSQILNTQ